MVDDKTKKVTEKVVASKPKAKKAATPKAKINAKVIKKDTAPKKPVAKKTAPSKAKIKTGAKKSPIKEKYSPKYREFYEQKIVPSLMKEFKYNSAMEVPRLDKITLNMGVGDAKLNPKALESAVQELTLISAQKAVVTHAKNDVSNFKIRKGFPVGCTVNLRGNRMYDFFERLNSIALPRTRDFRGLSFKSFDRRGNYNFGIKEQIVFTEINYDKIDAIRGLDVAIATSAKSDEEAYALLKAFGFPLREKPVKKSEVAEEN